MAGGFAWQEVGETATAADGTHPTGMHPCIYLDLRDILQTNKKFHYHLSRNAYHINVSTRTI